MAKKKYPMPKWAKSQTIRMSGLLENVCEHGVGHPSEEWLQDHPERKHLSIHGCDGCCCQSEETSQPKKKKQPKRRSK